MTDSAGHFYEFGPFRVDVANLLLFRDGQPLSLAPKAVKTPEFRIATASDRSLRRVRVASRIAPPGAARMVSSPLHGA